MTSKTLYPKIRLVDYIWQEQRLTSITAIMPTNANTIKWDAIVQWLMIVQVYAIAHMAVNVGYQIRILLI